MPAWDDLLGSVGSLQAKTSVNPFATWLVEAAQINYRPLPEQYENLAGLGPAQVETWSLQRLY